MKKGIKVIKSFIQALCDTVNHDGIEHAGYLSFLLMLAIFPFLFFMMALVNPLVSLFGQEHVSNYLIPYISSDEANNFFGVLKPRIKEIIAKLKQLGKAIATCNMENVHDDEQFP